MRDFSDAIGEQRRRLAEAAGYLNVAEGRNRLTELESEMQRPDLWDDAERAKQVNGEYANVRDDVTAYDALAARLADVELRSLFTGEHDDSPCIVLINAKDGGVDAQDFAEMLLRMYGRWAELRGFTTQLTYESEGAEAGINSAEFTITGRYAYGLMRGESGTPPLR